MIGYSETVAALSNYFWLVSSGPDSVDSDTGFLRPCLALVLSEILDCDRLVVEPGWNDSEYIVPLSQFQRPPMARFETWN